MRIPLICQCAAIAIGCLVISTVSTPVAASAPNLPQPPNVLLLVADDLGYAELGCQGNDSIKTPKLDAFSQTAVRCTQAYVTAPNCSPSRAGFLTGRIPLRFGYEFNPIGARNEDPQTGLPTQQQTMAEYLHDAGYTTGLVGKWHLGGAADFHPQRHGFDEFFGFLHEGHYFVPSPWNETTTWIRRKGLPPGHSERYQVTENLVYSSHMGHDEPDYDANNPILREGQSVVETTYFTDAITREATSFINRYRTSPWFLYVAYNAVHSPLQAKNKTLAQFSDEADIHRRIFLAMLFDLDKSVGQILEILEGTGQSKKTLVVFFSDNGGPTKETTASNLPLRDGKGSMYEGGIRVPFLVRWPGQLEGGTVSESIISTLDLFPTLTDIIGAKAQHPLDGIPITKAIRDPDSANERTLYWRQGKRAALRQGRWKIVAPSGHDDASKWQIFDLETDPSEAKDLSQSDDHHQRMKELLRQWNALNQQMAEPLF